jgi:periplasmic divalent cation tolerance protein
VVSQPGEKIVMSRASDYMIISTTTAKKSDALRLAKTLASHKLVACTQIIGPIISIYKWEGKLQQSKEWLCVTKAKKSDYLKMEKVIKSVHPYDLPEIIATPIIKGSSEYLNWLDQQMR